MKKPLAVLIPLFPISLTFLNTVFGGGLPWPVKREIDLASGFGDYRNGRFHAGLDIRTGGVTGEPVFSPVDGYVWRIRTNYEGYGKALYVRGPDERIYVFAHLAKLIPEINKVVKAAQLEAQRYYVDLYLTPDSIKVTAGQLLAQSGETGAGPPHLHFETRSPDNRPLNPLLHGFELVDETRPVFERIGFQVTDDSSMFDNGLRKVFYHVKKSERIGEYYLDTSLYFNCPFGVLADCYDVMRPSGMRETVRKLSFFIDDVPYYESVFDTLDYSTEPSVNFEYDYTEAIEDRAKVRRLYFEDGNQFVGSKAKSGFRGYVGEAVTEKPGKRSGKIVAEDCCGNQSTLTFDFYWGPSGNIFNLDSTVAAGQDTTRFYFSAIPEFGAFDIDSVATFTSRGNKWGPPNFVKTLFTGDGKVVTTTVTDLLRPKLLRLLVFTRGGCAVKDNLFNGILEQLPKSPSSVSVTSDDEGLWVKIENPNLGASKAWVKLYHENVLLGYKESKLISNRDYRCFIPPKEDYVVVDKIGVVLGEKPDGYEYFVDSLKLYAVGFGPKEIISGDGRFKIHLGENTLYRPMFIQLKQHYIMNKVVLDLNSDAYEILPEAFRCREEFNLTYEMIGDLPKNLLTGLCWMDKKERKWVWLDNINQNNVLTAKSRGGGSFGAVVDYENPLIWNLNIRPNQQYADSLLTIRFALADSLSAFEDDRSIVIELDGKWVIPEYDPETNICITQPNEPLANGEHHLAIEAIDRAGNKSEKYLKFKIRRP